MNIVKLQDIELTHRNPLNSYTLTMRISELKWTGMGEFNSDDHDIYYCGRGSLRGNGVAIMVNKSVQNAVLGCNLKKTE